MKESENKLMKDNEIMAWHRMRHVAGVMAK
jgi:hypothetical protein